MPDLNFKSGNTYQHLNSLRVQLHGVNRKCAG